MFNEVAIRTAPVSQHLFAIRTVFVLHMRNKAMFNIFERQCFQNLFGRTIFVFYFFIISLAHDDKIAFSERKTYLQLVGQDFP